MLKEQEPVKTFQLLVDGKDRQKKRQRPVMTLLQEQKNASAVGMHAITDDELLNFMKERFEIVCYRDLDYFEGTPPECEKSAVWGNFIL